MTVRRRFADVGDRQIHYLTAGEEHRAKPPIVILHASLWSPRQFAPFLEELGNTRWVLAPDHYGQGDSSEPTEADPNLAYFSDAIVELLDAVDAAEADLLGLHSGSILAADIAARHGDRVRRLVLEGLEPKRVVDESYIDALGKGGEHVDEIGSQFLWAWHLNRDVHLFLPFHRRDAEHATGRGVPAAPYLHTRTVDVLRNLEWFHMVYVAALRHDLTPQFSKISVPTMMTGTVNDKNRSDLEAVLKALPDGRLQPFPDGVSFGDTKAVCALALDFLS